MAKVTEQDVIIFLREKVAKLQLELQKTQAALDAFVGAEAPQPASSSEVVEETPAAAPQRRRGRRPAPPKETVRSLDAPAEFLADDKLENKIAYVLSDIGPSFNTEIIERMKELEPGKDADKLGRSVMVKLSSLQKAGKIKGSREGRKIKYGL